MQLDRDASEPATEVEHEIVGPWIEVGEQGISILGREVAMNWFASCCREGQDATSGGRPCEQPVGDVKVESRARARSGSRHRPSSRRVASRPSGCAVVQRSGTLWTWALRQENALCGSWGCLRGSNP